MLPLLCQAHLACRGKRQPLAGSVCWVCSLGRSPKLTVVSVWFPWDQVHLRKSLPWGTAPAGSGQGQVLDPCLA